MKVKDPYHRDRLKYEATPGEVAVKMTGFRPLREAKMSDVEKVRQYRQIVSGLDRYCSTC